MNSIHIRTNFPRVAAELEKLGEAIGNKAMVRAMNATLEQGKIQMARQISQEFRVSVAQVKYRLELRKASAKGGALRFEAVLSASNKAKGRSMNIIAFVERSVSLAEGRRRVKGGEGGSYTWGNGVTLKKAHELRFQIKRSGGQKLMPGAFIGNDGRTVFIRTGKDRLPIRAVNTIDVPQMFNARRINEVVRSVMLQKFDAYFTRELGAVTRGFLK